MKTASPPTPEPQRSRPRGRALWVVAALGLAPKCVLCLSAYAAGSFTLLGISTAELCGATDTLDDWSLLAALGALGLAALSMRRFFPTA